MEGAVAGAPDAGPVEGRWAKALIRFNLEPAEYADPSWLPDWAPEASPRVRQELSRGLLRDQGLEALCDWSLRDYAARMFMMDTAARRRVALAVGVAAHRDSLRQVVRKERLTMLSTCLGDALSTLWLSVAESVPRAPGELTLQWEPFDAGGLVRRLTRIGDVQLLRVVKEAGNTQRAAASRAAFCLPRQSEDQRLDKPSALSAAHSARMTEKIISDLIPRWAPEWTWLF